MSYYRGYSSGYTKNNYPEQYSRNRDKYGSGYNNNRQGAKHSGCRMRSTWTSKKTGEVHESPLINGWNYSRQRGMISFVAVAAKKPLTSKKEWIKYVLKMSYKDGRKPELFTAFWNLNTNRLHVPDLGMIANPSKNYFGKAYRTKNR